VSISNKEQILMITRYVTNLTLALTAGFLVVASQAFSAGTYSWLSFGVGLAIGAIALGCVALRRRGIFQRSLDAAIGVLAAWIIVSSLVFGAGVVVWLGFSTGVAVLALAIAGLTANELSAERVVHSLEVNTHRENATDGRAGIHA
jgi:asparagine N-glycosylation enzyme membrane subunit Stt3